MIQQKTYLFFVYLVANAPLKPQQSILCNFTTDAEPRELKGGALLVSYK